MTRHSTRHAAPLARYGLAPLVVIHLLVALIGAGLGENDWARAAVLSGAIVTLTYSINILLFALLDTTAVRSSLAIALGTYTVKIVLFAAVVALPGVRQNVSGVGFAVLLLGSVAWWLVVHIRSENRLAAEQPRPDSPTRGHTG